MNTEPRDPASDLPFSEKGRENFRKHVAALAAALRALYGPSYNLPETSLGKRAEPNPLSC